jgi:hypothetical protein
MKLADLPGPPQGAPQEVPSPGNPRFIFCASAMQTGACWHFHSGPGGRMGDFYTGYVDTGDFPVSGAVAASSAFPPACEVPV